MKKILLYLAAVMLLAAGCDTGVPAGRQAGSGKLSVVTSFYPMYDFAVKIGGDRAEVTNLVPSGTEPHDWEPSTADIVRLEKADVFIYNGLNLEHWTERVLSSLQNKGLVSVAASDGIAVKGGEGDPHVWLNPQFAIKELENIKNAMAASDPENKEYYERNYEKYAGQFNALDKEYKDAVSRFSRKDIVVDHAAFGHLCSAYGLNQVAVEGLAAESEPDAARMAEVVDFVTKNGVNVVFSEDPANTKVAEALSRETGAGIDVLNPLEGLTDEQINAGDEYLSVMRRNLEALKKALEA